MSYFSKRRAARDAASRPPGGRPFDGEASTDHDQDSNPNYGSQEDSTALNYRVLSSELDLEVIEGEEKPTVSLSAPSSQSMPVAYQQVAVRPWSRKRADNDISPRTASNTSSRSTGNKAATDEEIPPIETQDHYIASSASTPVLKRKTRKRSGEIGELDQDSSSSRTFGATDDLMAVSSPSSSAFGVPSHSPLSSSFSSTSTQSSTPTRRDRHRSIDMERIGHGTEDPSSLSHSFHSHRSFGQQQQQHQIRSIGGNTARWSTTIGGGSANLNLSSGSLDSYVVEGNQGQDLQAESEGVVDLATWNRPNSWQSRGSTATGNGIQPSLSSTASSFSTGAALDTNKSPRLYNGSMSLSDLPPNSSRSDSASTAFSTQFRVNKVPSASSRRRSVGARAKYRSFSYSSEDRSTTTTTFSDTVSHQSPHYAYGGGAGTVANAADANGPGRSRYRGFSYSSEAMLTSTPLETPLTKRISAPNSPIATSNAQASSSSSLTGTHRLHLNGGSSAAYTSPLETHNFGPGPVTFSWTYQLRSPPAKRKRRFSTGAIDEGSQRSSGGTGGSNGNDLDQSEPNHRIHPSAPSAYAPSAGHDALGGNQAPIARRAYVPHQGSPGSFPAFMDSSQAFSSVSVPLTSHLNAQNYGTHLHPTSQETDSSTSDGLHEWSPTQPSHLTPAGLRHSQLYSSGHQYRFTEAPPQTLHQSTLISTSDRSRSLSPFVPPQSRTPSLGMHIDSMTLDTSATSPAPRWTGSQPRDISARFASALEHGSRPKEGPYANTGAENSSPESTESLWQSPMPHKTRRRGGGSLLNPDASSSIPFSDDSSVSSFGDFATNSAAELDSIDAIYHQSTSSAATTSSSLSSGLGFSGSSLGSIAISGPISMHAGSSSDAQQMGMAAQHVPTSSQNAMDADPANAKPASATARFLSGRRYKLRSTSTEANVSSSTDLLPEVSEEQRAKRRRRSEEPHSVDAPRKGSAHGGTTTQVSSSSSTSGGPSTVAGKEDETHSSSLHPHQHHSLRSPGRSTITSVSSSSPANGSSPSSSTSSVNSTPGSVDPSRSRRTSQLKSTPSSSPFTTSPRALLPPLETPTSTVVSMGPSKRWDLNDTGLRHILLNRPDRFNSSDEGDYIDRTSVETESADSDAPYGADVDDDEDDEDPTAHLFLLPMPSFQAQSTTSPRGKDRAAGPPIAVSFDSSKRNRQSIQALPEMSWTHKSQSRRMDPSSMEPMNEDNPFTRRRSEAIIAKLEAPRSVDHADHATMDSNMDEEDQDERKQYLRQSPGKRVYRHKLTLSDNGPEKTRLKIFTRYIPQDTWDSGGDSRTTTARLAYVSDSATIQDRERPREWNDPDYATDASSEDPDQVNEVDEEDTSQIGENHPEDTSQMSEIAPEDGPSFAVHMDSHTMQSTSNPSLASQVPYIRQTAPVMRSTIHLVQTYQAIQQLIQTTDLEEDAARSKSSSAPYYYPKQGEIIGDGRYRVVGYLGRGSFGCVVKALVLSESQQLANRADSSATTPKGGPEDPFSDLPQTVGGSTSTGGHGSQFPFPPLNLPKSQPQRPSQRSARSTASSQDGSSSMGDEGSEMDEDEELEQYVAIKISRKGASFLQQGKREVSMLERIHNYQSKQENHDLDLFVRALDTFFLDGHLCIVLELLADSLFDLVKYSWDVRPERPGLSLRMVRKMTHQLLCALITLRNMKIIHCDLKPENIALTQPNKPRLKVLDFGSSCSLSDSYLNQFPYIQSRYYRAPEILLGTGYSCSIDMWSLGCVVAELYLGRPLFEGANSVEQIYCIIDILGMPSDNVLRNAVYLSKFFQKVGVDEQGRSVLGPVRKTNLLPKTTIKELVESKNESNTPLHLKYFTDLLVRMLKWDPQQRITPLEAVNHNFILYGPKSNGD